MTKAIPVLLKHGEKKGKLGAVSLLWPTSYSMQYYYISMYSRYPHVRPALYLKTTPQVYMLSNLDPLMGSLVSSLPLGNLKSPILKVKSNPKDCIFMGKKIHFISTVSHTGLCSISIGILMWICIVINKHSLDVSKSQVWKQKLTSHLPPTFRGPWEFQGTFLLKVKLPVRESEIVGITEDPWTQQPHNENCFGLIDSLCFE